ncbi:MAG: GNAT family N-acetyltransferase [Acidobacteriota bacterium]
MSIRKLRPSDRDPIERILRGTGVFSEQEVSVALELIDIANGKPEQTDYEIYIAEDPPARIAGYICYGPVPLTQGVYDLYWIAVSQEVQGQGIGKALLTFMEESLAGRRARKVMIETSSTGGYLGTRAFYERNGYREIARIRDFYRPGDDKVIFSRELSALG